MNIETAAGDATVPGFILQPLVENSIVYSMESLETAEIEISAREKGNKMIFSVKDNGPGIAKKNERAARNGIGLTNTLERLKKLHGDDHKFSMQNVNGGGLHVAIEIPFRLAR